MSYCVSKDRNFGGNRSLNIADPSNTGERIHVIVECILCIEAENEVYTKYAHPKAHLEAHTQATNIVESLAIKEKTTEDYLYYYTFHYGREYIKIYKNLYDKYRNEYNEIVLERTYDKKDIICDYHLDTIRFHHEFKEEEVVEEEVEEE